MTSIKVKTESKRTNKIKKEQIEIKSEDDKTKKPTKRNHISELSDVEAAGPSKKPKVEKALKDEFAYQWEDYELVCESLNLATSVVKTTLKLFKDGNTIPFIARYRKSETGNLDPEQLRTVKEEYDKVCHLKERSQTVLKNLKKCGQLNECLRVSVLNSRSIEELEHVYAPYKVGSKGSLAERAKALGLENVAVNVMNGSRVSIASYVNKSKEGLTTEVEVEKGIVNIIAAIIASDTDILALLRKISTEHDFYIETKKHNTRSKLKDSENKKNIDASAKFELYYDFKITKSHIKPHHVLAINRAESLKIISVKVLIPNFIFHKISALCRNKWRNQYLGDILEKAILDSYNRLVQPFIIRRIRSDLKDNAEKASCDVFSMNLKQLLLTQPLKARSILGIDPGFAKGCKIAVISENSAVLATDIIYPDRKRQEAKKCLTNLLKSYNCSLIALGNGTACRETEAWLSDLLNEKAFTPLDVSYVIVNESGASIYSCSSEAKKEFPDMDPNLISAVSLARRVQEPLAELVKVAPKHLGVGMYQHDLPKKQLEQALNEVVSECVSFVGVDLNTASQCLLQHIAGLSEKRAKNIIDYRQKCGSFSSRQELLKVSGIGNKIFEQCAGFLRVTGSNSSSVNVLDGTYIHPESYDIALKLLKKLNLKLDEIGQIDFINAIKMKRETINRDELCQQFKTSEENLDLIFDSFSKPLNFDLRSESSQIPVFKKGLTKMSDLRGGQLLTGCISNVTSFGCFADIGVGKDGLIHVSKMRGYNLQVGDRVEVEVLNVEIDKNRVKLMMVKKL